MKGSPSPPWARLPRKREYDFVGQGTAFRRHDQGTATCTEFERLARCNYMALGLHQTDFSLKTC